MKAAKVDFVTLQYPEHGIGPRSCQHKADLPDIFSPPLQRPSPATPSIGILR
jgi:hypothetical protein